MKINSASNEHIEQHKLYEDQGFLIVENLFLPEECDELNQRAEDVVLGKVKMADGSEIYMEPDALKLGLVTEAEPNPAYLFKLGHQMHVSDPVFRYYAMHDRILDILTHLTGPDLKCVQSMFIDKPAMLGVGQPNHQDSHYLKMDPDTLIAVWIACDDIDVADGGLHVVPGSQHDPIHPHEKPINEEQSYYHEVHSARQRTEGN